MYDITYELKAFIKNNQHHSCLQVLTIIIEEWHVNVLCLNFKVRIANLEQKSGSEYSNPNLEQNSHHHIHIV